ncbi:MAG: ATP-binding protein, partial [Anaerovoracaceae bacterium]
YKEMVEYYTLWAHQIKTPISALYLMIEREGREQDRPLAQQLFFVEQYVEMALHYLRSDSISADLDLAEYSIDKIIREVIKKHSRQFIYKKIQLNFQDSGELVLTDEKWLAFVLEQLISNSLKYTKEGSISIYMEENKTLVIEDTGIGIREEDLPRICEKGFTGFNGRMDKKSTGIGLYLCKKILTKLSHTIEFESVSCKGTKVKIGLSTHAPIRE